LCAIAQNVHKYSEAYRSLYFLELIFPDIYLLIRSWRQAHDYLMAFLRIIGIR